MNRVGNGSVCQAGLQSAWGTPVAPDTLLNMTGETIKTTVEKGDEGNLLGSKTRNQADVMSVKVDGGISLILRPEFIDWLLESGLGSKNDNVYTLAAPNTELPVSTVLLSRGGIVKTYPDVTIKSIKISAAAQDYVKVDIDIAGVKELNAGETGAQTVQTLSLTLPSYRCTQATLKYATGGTAKASISQTICVKECNISIDNGVEDAPATYCSGLFAGRPVPGLRSVGVDFSIPYSDAVDTLRNTYYKDPSSPTVALLLKFTTSDPDENVEIYIPHVCITSADGNVGGAGLIDSSFSGEALSVGNTEPITITVNHKED
ncbi:MAG: hypothetical protein J5800_01625 [Spirochaetales bacterium]|nr:hypothetical protein [Spirochaetales bacterium]